MNKYDQYGCSIHYEVCKTIREIESTINMGVASDLYDDLIDKIDELKSLLEDSSKHMSNLLDIIDKLTAQRDKSNA